MICLRFVECGPVFADKDGGTFHTRRHRQEGMKPFISASDDKLRRGAIWISGDLVAYLQATDTRLPFPDETRIYAVVRSLEQWAVAIYFSHPGLGHIMREGEPVTDYHPVWKEGADGQLEFVSWYAYVDERMVTRYDRDTIWKGEPFESWYTITD